MQRGGPIVSVPVLTFFNNNGGVGKTSLVYHVAWMLSELECSVLVADLDPQATLTATFLDEDALESLWDSRSGFRPQTIYDCVEALTEFGDFVMPELRPITPGLQLLPGSPSLAKFEGNLSSAWMRCLESDNLDHPFRIVTAFWQVMQYSAVQCGAKVVLVDSGSSLSAINRSALIATDFVVVPLRADLVSRQGLRILGPTLNRWRGDWRQRRMNWSKHGRGSHQSVFALPEGGMEPVGYVIRRHGVRLHRPVVADDRWARQIPGEYKRHVLGQVPNSESTTSDCIATLKPYRSLVSLGQDARRPIFKLSVADGAIGSHAAARLEAFRDFEELVKEILRRANIPISVN